MNDNFKDCVARPAVKSIFSSIIHDNEACDVTNLEKKCIHGSGGWGVGGSMHHLMHFHVHERQPYILQINNVKYAQHSKW